MDFRFSEEERAFRKEVQAFLLESLPPGWPGQVNMFHEEAVEEVFLEVEVEVDSPALADAAGYGQVGPAGVAAGVFDVTVHELASGRRVNVV